MSKSRKRATMPLSLLLCQNCAIVSINQRTVEYYYFKCNVCYWCMQAGQATEPECLVAVGLAAGDDGQVRML